MSMWMDPPQSCKLSHCVNKPHFTQAFLVSMGIWVTSSLDPFLIVPMWTFTYVSLVNCHSRNRTARSLILHVQLCKILPVFQSVCTSLHFYQQSVFQLFYVLCNSWYFLFFFNHPSGYGGFNFNFPKDSWRWAAFHIFIDGGIVHIPRLEYSIL